MNIYGMVIYDRLWCLWCMCLCFWVSVLIRRIWLFKQSTWFVRSVDGPGQHWPWLDSEKFDREQKYHSTMIPRPNRDPCRPDDIEHGRRPSERSKRELGLRPNAYNEHKCETIDKSPLVTRQQ